MDQNMRRKGMISAAPAPPPRKKLVVPVAKKVLTIAEQRVNQKYPAILHLKEQYGI
jgi:hypothetical protein